jgi:hypothetical protein
MNQQGLEVPDMDETPAVASSLKDQWKRVNEQRRAVAAGERDELDIAELDEFEEEDDDLLIEEEGEQQEAAEDILVEGDDAQVDLADLELSADVDVDELDQVAADEGEAAVDEGDEGALEDDVDNDDLLDPVDPTDELALELEAAEADAAAEVEGEELEQEVEGAEEEGEVVAEEEIEQEVAEPQTATEEAQQVSSSSSQEPVAETKSSDSSSSFADESINPFISSSPNTNKPVRLNSLLFFYLFVDRLFFCCFGWCLDLFCWCRGRNRTWLPTCERSVLLPLFFRSLLLAHSCFHSSELNSAHVGALVDIQGTDGKVMQGVVTSVLEHVCLVAVCGNISKVQIGSQVSHRGAVPSFPVGPGMIGMSDSLFFVLLLCLLILNDCVDLSDV